MQVMMLIFDDGFGIHLEILENDDPDQEPTRNKFVIEVIIFGNK